MEVSLVAVHLTEQPEEQGEEGRVQEGGSVAARRTQDHIDGFGIGAEEPWQLAEVPVEDLRHQLQESGEEGMLLP